MAIKVRTWFKTRASSRASSGRVRGLTKRPNPTWTNTTTLSNLFNSIHYFLGHHSVVKPRISRQFPPGCIARAQTKCLRQSLAAARLAAVYTLRTLKMTSPHWVHPLYSLLWPFFWTTCNHLCPAQKVRGLSILSALMTECLL